MNAPQHSLRHYNAITASLAAEARTAFEAQHGPRPASVPTYGAGGSGRSANTDAQNKAQFDAFFDARDRQRAWDRQYQEALAKVKADLAKPLPVSTPDGLVWPATEAGEYCDPREDAADRRYYVELVR